MDPAVWTAIGAIGGSLVTATGGVVLELVKRRRAGPRLTLPPPVAALHDAATPRVLVVDDNGDMRTVERHVLEGLGLIVDMAATLAEARVLYATQAYALVIVDLVLPDGDGAAFLAALPPRRIIYTGASKERLDAARQRQVADAVLDKDGDIDRLEAIVRELLKLPQPG